VFVHSFFYIRTDRGIAAPGDLRGRRVGIAEYQHTAYVWSRGLLHHEYGVPATDVTWVSVPGKHGSTKESDFQTPPDVSIEHMSGAKTPSELLEQGEIDALISPGIPDCYTRKAKNVARLFPDHEAVEEAYYARTGIYPILHVMGLRNELAQQHPALAHELFKAFVAAKDIVLNDETRNAAAPSAPAALAAQVARMTRMMGRDYRAYGLAENERNTLQAFLEYHHEQGLSDRRLDIAETFSPIPVSDYAV
jgi:4,5-dihydroxyphthalate decarboxylase